MYSLDCKKTACIIPTEVKFNPISIEILKDIKCTTLTDIIQQKNKIEFCTRCGLTEIYRSARFFCYPEKAELGQQRNRAGRKLKEIFDEFPELSTCESFLDLCGGPGAWSLFMLEIPSITGSGITIKTNDACRNWYDEIHTSKNYRCLEISETNDVCDLHVREKLGKESFDLVLADGAPSEKTYPDENLQELYAARIIFSEISIGCTCLTDKGKLVIKIFDSFTDTMKSLIYLIIYSFKKVFVYKPPSSRPVNSERYLICLDYKRKVGLKTLLPIVDNVLLQWKQELYPSSLIPVHNFHSDTKFYKSYEKYINESSTEQVKALTKVNDVLDEWTTNRSNKQNEKDSFGKNEWKGKGKRKGGKYISNVKGDKPSMQQNYRPRKGKGKGSYWIPYGKGPRTFTEPY